jgi:DNA-directed RNA polymerase specialized sigma24 family protein
MTALPALQHGHDDARRFVRAVPAASADRSRRWGSLLERLGAGDAAALAPLYDESSSLTFGLILHMLQDRRAAEDALVDLYGQVRALACSRTADEEAVSWLVRLARSVALARMNRPDGEPLHRERQAVTHALNQLTPRQRTILEITYFGGRTTRDAAAELQLSNQQVVVEIRQALLTLRSAMA